MNDVYRPITSKVRGICKYYTTTRGCFAGDKCKFLHTTEPPIDPSGLRPPALTPYDKAKRCKYYAEGYCKRGAKCWFLHDIKEDPLRSGRAQADDEEFCSICFEKPSTYGLLGGCSHIFCIECIRQWRDPLGKGGEIDNTKKCPMCRAKCRYIIPSSRFWKEGQEEKARVVQKYKESMSKVACKHFAASKKKNPAKPMCPFGKDCFYQHLNHDRTPHISKYGIVRSMREWRNSTQRNSGSGLFSFITGDGIDLRTPFAVDFIPDVGSFEDAVNMTETIAIDLYDRMVVQVSARRGRGDTSGNRRRRDNFHELDRARMEMVASAVSAARGGLHRRETLPNQNLRPVVVPGTLAPSHWDLDGDGEEVDNGWGWNDLVTEAAHNGNTDIMERLELLANHMLGSTRIIRGRDTESSPPPLEPIGRQDTPPPPLIPVDTGEQVDDDDGEMPLLESVSNSSESEDGGSNDEQDSDYEQTDRVHREERTLNLAFNITQRLEEAQNLAFNLTQRLEEAHSPPLRSPGDAAYAPRARSRFSTVVDREGGRADIDEDEDSEADDERGAEAQQTEETPPTPTPTKPPFVTDGRGRVVWSNKDTETTPEPPIEPAGESQPRATGSRSLLGRVFDACMH